MTKLYYPEEINERIKKGMGCCSQIREGWFPLVIELDKKISKLAPDYVIDQVKEKFGTLRFYIGALDSIYFDEVYKLIRDTEELSSITCDVCGVTGKSITLNGWYVTRCEKHANRES